MIPFHRPSIGEEEIAAVVDTLRSGWLSSGPKVKQFEEAFAQNLNVKHAIAVNSCTAALHLSLEAIGLLADEFVITTPLTFAATSEVIRYFGAHPLFVDVNDGDGNINPYHIEMAIVNARRLGKKVRAILPVDFAGNPCDLYAIKRIADYYNLKVVEDAAHAFPAAIGLDMIGGISDLTCFSFYATKTITTGEGGMVTTNNDAYAERIKRMRLHGVDRDIWNRYNSDKPKWYYLVEDVGFKYNMTDIAAAMGLVQLKRAYEFWGSRLAIAERYREAFADLPIRLPEEQYKNNSSWHLYVIRLDPRLTSVKRDDFIVKMAKLGVGTSVHFIPLHLHPYYVNKYKYRPLDFPWAMGFYESCVSLPIYPSMTDSDVSKVIDSVRKILYGEVR